MNGYKGGRCIPKGYYEIPDYEQNLKFIDAISFGIIEPFYKWVKK